MQAQTNGSWNTNAAGDWSSTNNWLNGLVANGIGSTANLTFDITAPTTVSIDTGVTLGALNIGDASTSYTLALTTGSLTFNNGGSGATIAKTSGSVAQTISAGFTLEDNLTISNGTSSALTLSGAISNGLSGAKTITKTGSGSGAVILSGANTAFTGDVVISGGILQLGSGTSLGASNLVRVDSGATLRANSSVSIAGLNDNAGTGGSVANGSGGGKTLTIAGNGSYSFNGSFTGNASGTKVGLAISGTGTQILGGNNTTNIGYQAVTGGGTLVFAKQNSIFQGLTTGAVTNNNNSGNAGIYVSSGSTVALGLGDTNSGYFDSAAVATFLDGTHMGLSTASAGFVNNSILGLDTRNVGGSFLYSNALANIGTSTGIGFAKLGSGTLILISNSTYTGVTQVREGTLQVGNGGTAGSISTNTATVSSGATLDFNRSDTALTVSAKITGAGSVSKNGSGQVALDATNSDYSGGTTITGGRLNAKSLGSGSVTMNGTATTLSLSAAATYSNSIFISGGTGLNGQGMIDTASGINAVLSGPISITATPTVGTAGHFGSSGTGSLLVSGAITSSVPVIARRGTVIFSGGGTGYSALQVREGTVKLGTNNGIATTATVSIGGNAAATLDLSGYNQSLAGMSKSNNAATILNNGGTDATLTTTGTSSYGGAIQDGTNGSKVGLTVNGGSLTLSGTNTYTGTTTVSAGILAVTNGSAIADAGTVTLANVSGATFSVDASETIGSLQGGGATGGNVSIASGQTLTVAESGSQTFSGLITNSGSLTKSGNGTLILSGNNTYSGTTTISAGTLQIGSGSTSGSIGFTSGVTNNATLAYNRSDNLTAGYAISGSGHITKGGNGTLTLSGNNTFSGNVDVNAGLLNLNSAVGGAAASTAAVSVASGATLLISKSEQVSDTASVTLSGGTISRASGASETFGVLNLTASSTLDFGSGTSGNMTFGIYEGDATPSALLTVNNFFGGNTLVFGSDLSSYISASYSGTSFTSTYFNINSISGGFTSNWNSGTSTFTITAIPEPSTYLAAVLLVGLLTWPAFRACLIVRLR